MPVLRWPGATARYSHFRVPVETGTPPHRRRKVRSAPFPPGGENCARSLAPKSNPLTLGFDLGGGFAAEYGRMFAKSAQLRFRLTAKTAPAPLLLLSKPDPLALGFGLAGGFTAIWEKTVLVWEN